MRLVFPFSAVGLLSNPHPHLPMSVHNVSTQTNDEPKEPPHFERTLFSNAQSSIIRYSALSKLPNNSGARIRKTKQIVRLLKFYAILPTNCRTKLHSLRDFYQISILSFCGPGLLLGVQWFPIWKHMAIDTPDIENCQWIIDRTSFARRVSELSSLSRYQS